ncbi:hypothetical protein [Streptomyces malaysiensis]|uniref:Integral membrane protein n=1 Tax=Streptomyces malaysiensis TaxID=92644 RepID=A0A7X5X459_STRMQ|nr:hypothetical protein [Streptomyces malaysiensis]NIY66239.1 hypothetical protein [Streptomyces malaysiensis]
MSRTTPLLREQQSSSSSSSSAPGGQNGDQRHEDNPFAPPPEGRPDQPWRPRPDGADGNGGEGRRPEAQGGHQDGQDGQNDQDGRQPQQPPAWGSQWSSRQPGRQSGGFGLGPGSNRPSGPGGTGGPRWDPNDPAQRRARYALLAGMWAFFFALFSLPQIALLLGALALYWGISSLRAKPRRTAPPPAAAAPLNAPPPPPGATPAALPAPGSGSAKPQATAAISGLVTGVLALAIVAATFSFQVVYSDYYTCVDDALTQSSRHDCETLLPEQLRPLLSTQD